MTRKRRLKSCAKNFNRTVLIERPYKLGLILPDTHPPYHDRASIAAVLAYAKTLYLDYCIALGDWIDFNCISSFIEDSPGEIEHQSIYNDYTSAGELWDDTQAAVRKRNKACKIVYLEGNHEYRVENYINKYPQNRGLLEVERNLDLTKRDIKWVRFWSDKQRNTFRIGKATFIHGCYCNKYHAQKHVDEYWGQGVFYGHTHDVQEYSKSFSGHDETVRAKSMGCLCDYDQRYLKGSTTKWQQAFGVFYFFPDGSFQDITIPIFGHKFVGLNGKVYDGTQLVR